MWTNIRRPLKVALRICLQTLHLNEHSSTPQSGSKNMFTNLACERTFVDPSKWLKEYVYKPCMWTNIRRPLKVALRICLQNLHMNEHSWYLLMSNILLGMGMCTAVKDKVTCDLALCTTIIFPFTFINYNSPLSVPKAHLGYILIYCSQSPRGIPGRYL
jgi:hypothetical protein